MAPKALPSQALVRQLLHYDPESGIFTRRPRPRDMFPDDRAFNHWNATYRERPPGSLNWFGYLMIYLPGSTYRAHRLAWLYVHGEPVPDVIDHADGNPLNNRISNLRAATFAGNRANSILSSRNTTGFKGLKATKQGRFRAILCSRKKKQHLGTYDTAEEAAAVYRTAAAALYGEFMKRP